MKNDSSDRPQGTLKKSRLSRPMLYALCVFFAIGFLFPISWSLLNSFRLPAETSASPATFLPSELTLENYRKLTQLQFGQSGGIFHYFYNSVLVAFITVAGTIILSTLAGFGFSRFNFRGKTVMFTMILITLMIPFQSILTPLFVILRILKLTNTLWGLSLVYITFQLPFGVFMMRNTFATVPRELEEAALIDGCSTFSMLYHVMLKLVRPGIITVAIYAFLNSWNEFLAALIFMLQEDKFTLPIFLASVTTGLYGNIDWGALQAGIIISISPCILLFLLLQRYYMQGLMGGAVKG
ncbi:MAG: carbohydrate ABC transporter permease [bacterium]|nr:carbohydrate ABC transporter permease [bacterium]